MISAHEDELEINTSLILTQIPNNTYVIQFNYKKISIIRVIEREWMKVKKNLAMSEKGLIKQIQLHRVQTTNGKIYFIKKWIRVA